MPMSPRNPQLQLQQVPGTPTQSHALPPMHHPPHPSTSHPPPSITSPPPTPSTANRPTSLSANAGAFVPGKKISIKNPSGQELNIDALKRAPPPAIPIVPVVPPSPASSSSKKDVKRPIRIESQEQKERRLAEERAREGDSDERPRSSDSFAKANEDATRRQTEERERELRKAEERKLKEEAELAEKERKEAEERAAREEKERKDAEERAAREEVERKEAEERAAREAREAAEREKERLRLEEARAQREAEEKAQRERAEQDRLRKLKEEEEAKEAAEQRRKAEEEALKAAEAAEATRALAEADAKPDSLPEEGEIVDEVSPPTTTEETLPSKTASVSPPPAPIPTDLSAKSPEKESLRIDTSIPSLPSPEHQRRRPGPLNLQTAITTNIPPALPSALATARHIEDINRITYPEGIKSPKVELNVNTQKGKFRCVLTVIDIRLELNNFSF